MPTHNTHRETPALGADSALAFYSHRFPPLRVLFFMVIRGECAALERSFSIQGTPSRHVEEPHDVIN